ncbi:hypothetical protein HPB52_022282 [Rhipicephalus sanguineus]|uniref:CCHC-type domain-containing protein n=1 Tax=Rhipicephalus sanguineus TaxID=34632 RepID=A0A9D4TBY6_RHISA|nr:hypothetical protein HPB52_022282 [Rhipicephalus sanguineus]
MRIAAKQRVKLTWSGYTLAVKAGQQKKTLIQPKKEPSNLRSQTPRLSPSVTAQDFYDNVRVQTQKVENVTIASTASTERASKLQGINAIQLGRVIYEVNPHIRHPDDVCRGVIYGLEPGTTPAEIVAGLRVDSRYSVLGARMLGSSTAAVITFDGQHVPFYVTYVSGDYRWKPYRKSVQYCRTCGAIGHRQDICPQPKVNFCYKCGCDKDTEAHDCQPKCKICGEDHETAGKECKKKLRSNPPPHQVRQQQLDNARAQEQHWSLSTGDFPGMATTLESSQAPSLHQGPDRSRPHSNHNGKSWSRTRSQSRSAMQVSYESGDRQQRTQVSSNHQRIRHLAC